MSRYTRTLYILVGSRTYSEWKTDFVNMRAGSSASAEEYFMMDFDTPPAQVSSWLESFASASSKSMTTMINIHMEDVVSKRDFGAVSDCIWCVQNYGNPGKIVLLAHGDVTSCISAFTDNKKSGNLRLPQKDFIETVFPIWPPQQPVGARSPSSPEPFSGIKTIALKQCNAARTDVSYAVMTADGTAFQAASGSAAEITARTLRRKGWSASGAVLTASPQENFFNSDTGVITMVAEMPIVEFTPISTELTLPKKHKVTLRSGKACVVIKRDLLAPLGVIQKDMGNSFWYANYSFKVGYPESWIREVQPLSWVIWLPEYVVCDPALNTIKSVVPLGASNMHLKGSPFKVRIQL